MKRLLVIACLLLGSAFVTQASYIQLKAALADWLITGSWSARPLGQLPAKPWPWADTRVVARLRVPALDISQFVMQDASGESLAFGPGSMRVDQVPGGPGHTLIAGHRDTHFSYLSRLVPGTELEVDGYRGERGRYRVVATRVIDIERERMVIDPDSQFLTLVTCWPLDALVPGGPLRYVITSERIDEIKPGEGISSVAQGNRMDSI